MGNSWILLRGLGRSQWHWGVFKQLFMEQHAQDEFEFLDLKGNGSRCQEISYNSIPEFMEDVRSRSEFIRQGKKVHLLAISLGGMVCAEWARKYPDEVASLTMVCTSSSESPFYRRFNLGVIPHFLKGALMASLAEREMLLLSAVTNNLERRQQELPQFIESSEKYPLKISNFLKQIRAAARYQFPPKPPVPVSLIGSFGDRLVSSQCTLDIAKKWGVEPIMHPSAGHDIGVDDPMWLLQQVKALK